MKEHSTLKRPPLLEAIFEIRWGATANSVAPIVAPNELLLTGAGLQWGIIGDPKYPIHLGRFSERAQKVYPFYEPLGTANLPEMMVRQVPQHRFRVAQGKWPLVQMGPGIMAVNQTADYTWKDFQSRCESAMRWLLDTRPDPAPLPDHIAILRYINSLPFDPAKQNVFEFLDKMLNTKVELPPKFFRNRGVSSSAAELNWQGTFQLTEFPGSVTVHFAVAKKDDLPVVIWGTVVQSTGDQIADLSREFPAWLENAHSITEDWFFGMIEGELERRFENGSVSHVVHRAVPGSH